MRAASLGTAACAGIALGWAASGVLVAASGAGRVAAAAVALALGLASAWLAARAEVLFRGDETRRLAAIVESSEDAIIGKDLEGRINVWNRSAERLFGYSGTEILGKPIEILMPPDRPDDWRRILERVVRGERVEHFETRRRTRDGRILDVSLTVSPVRDRHGRITGAAKIVRDVTAEQKARREAEKIRDLFLGTLGHDLRNPLNAISIAVHTLRRRASGEDEKILARISSSAERISRMIDQLLDFTVTRLGVGLRIRPVAVDLAALLRRVGEEFEGLHPGRVLVSSEGDVSGRWDGDRLEQVFSNLVSNALSHGAADSPVTVVARGCGPSSVAVDVVNRGPAIPESALPTLFDPFHRGPADDPPGVRGLGLGLFIAREIVRAHRGEIAVRSSAEGTTFSVTLPRTAD